MTQPPKNWFRNCEEYLEEEKALELDLKEREEIIRKETPNDVKKTGGVSVNEQRTDHSIFTRALVHCLGAHRGRDLFGAIRNWNWLCDPTGTRDAHRHSRGYRRVVFFLLGVLLIVVSIWGFVLKLK